MPRVVRHKHWPEGHPFYEQAEWHNVSMRECGERLTQFDHGHLGSPCIKDFQESKSKRGKMNTIATCTIITRPEHGQSFDTSLATQLAGAE